MKVLTLRAAKQDAEGALIVQRYATFEILTVGGQSGVDRVPGVVNGDGVEENPITANIAGLAKVGAPDSPPEGYDVLKTNPDGSTERETLIWFDERAARDVVVEAAAAAATSETNAGIDAAAAHEDAELAAAARVTAEARARLRESQAAAEADATITTGSYYSTPVPPFGASLVRVWLRTSGGSTQQGVDAMSSGYVFADEATGRAALVGAGAVVGTQYRYVDAAAEVLARLTSVTSGGASVVDARDGSGMLSVDLTASDVTLTGLNSRYPSVRVYGTLSAARALIVPDGWQGIVDNVASGAAVTVRTAVQPLAGIVVAAGVRQSLRAISGVIFESTTTSSDIDARLSSVLAGYSAAPIYSVDDCRSGGTATGNTARTDISATELPAGTLIAIEADVSSVGSGTTYLHLYSDNGDGTYNNRLRVPFWNVTRTGLQTLRAGTHFPAGIDIPAGYLGGWSQNSGTPRFTLESAPGLTIASAGVGTAVALTASATRPMWRWIISGKPQGLRESVAKLGSRQQSARKRSVDIAGATRKISEAYDPVSDMPGWYRGETRAYDFETDDFFADFEPINLMRVTDALGSPALRATRVTTGIIAELRSRDQFTDSEILLKYLPGSYSTVDGVAQAQTAGLSVLARFASSASCAGAQVRYDQPGPYGGNGGVATDFCCPVWVGGMSITPANAVSIADPDNLARYRYLRLRCCFDAMFVKHWSEGEAEPASWQKIVRGYGLEGNNTQSIIDSGFVSVAMQYSLATISSISITQLFRDSKQLVENNRFGLIDSVTGLPLFWQTKAPLVSGNTLTLEDVIGPEGSTVRAARLNFTVAQPAGQMAPLLQYLYHTPNNYGPNAFFSRTKRYPSVRYTQRIKLSVWTRAESLASSNGNRVSWVSNNYHYSRGGNVLNTVPGLSGGLNDYFHGMGPAGRIASLEDQAGAAWGWHRTQHIMSIADFEQLLFHRPEFGPHDAECLGSIWIYDPRVEVISEPLQLQTVSMRSASGAIAAGPVTGTEWVSDGTYYLRELIVRVGANVASEVTVTLEDIDTGTAVATAIIGTGTKAKIGSGRGANIVRGKAYVLRVSAAVTGPVIASIVLEPRTSANV